MPNHYRQSRPLHYILDLSGETICGKDRLRVRYTSNLTNWDDPKIAGGRRCVICAPIVNAMPREQAKEGQE